MLFPQSSWAGPQSMTGVLMSRRRFGHRHTGRKPCHDDRDWSEAPTRERMPSISKNHGELGRSKEGIHPVLPEGINPADTVISDNECLSLEAIRFVAICSRSPRELIQLISDSWMRLEKRNFWNEQSPKKLGKMQNAVSREHTACSHEFFL